MFFIEITIPKSVDQHIHPNRQAEKQASLFGIGGAPCYQTQS